MKRTRSEARRLGPAAAAMRRGHVFRDAREATAQITADQLIHQATEMHRFHAPSKTRSARVLIHNEQELALYRQKRRAEWEEKVKRGYKFVGNWVQYARWEAQQKDYVRVRAVFERALALHGNEPTLWREYAELEATHGHVEHSRAVWARAVAALPASTDLWLKYLLLEQAAGQEEKARALFVRWCATRPAPSCAYELHALYEVQRGRQELARQVLRDYVTQYNTVEAWWLYAKTEEVVWGRVGRAKEVLQTALEALPEALLYGPLDTRLPLALAELYAREGQVSEARALYLRLLSSPAHTSANRKEEEEHDSGEVERMTALLARYSQFEQMYGDAAHCATVCRVQARRVYEQRLQHNPSDYDAHLALYLLLREQARRAGSEGAGEKAQQQQEQAEAEAMSCLCRAVDIDPASSSSSQGSGAEGLMLHRMQQRAVLVMEYARVLERHGDVPAAQRVLAGCIRDFPFDRADCPRLWTEAAALELRQNHIAQARQLLSAASHVTHDPALFEARIALEESVLSHTSHSNSNDDNDKEEEGAQAMERLRAAYQAAIKAFPEQQQWWFRYAKLEERAGQPQRAQALYRGCITTLSGLARAAAESSNLTRRYELLAKVDAAWGRQILLAARRLRHVRGTHRESDEAVNEATTALREIHVALLHAVWADYRLEALRWRAEYVKAAEASESESKSAVATEGTAAVPTSLPEVLRPAMVRWSEAVEAMTAYAFSQNTASHSPAGSSSVTGKEKATSTSQARLLEVREVLRAMLLGEREGLRRALGETAEAATLSYDETQRVRAWTELLLAPMLQEWAKFEATHGGSLDAVKEVASPPNKRRTRLFHARK